MQIKCEANGHVEVTLSLEEAMERLLPNIYDQDRLIVSTALMNPLVFHIKGLGAQDLLRLKKEVAYRNGPLWDRIIDTKELTPRLGTLLGMMGIATFGQLVSNERNDFLKYRNIGKKTLSEIEDVVWNNGLDFIG